MRVLSDQVCVARKSYPCDASRAWNRSGYARQDVLADDWSVAESARSDRYRIKPGDAYRRMTYVDDGEVRTYRARLDMDAVCQRYELFDD